MDIPTAICTHLFKCGLRFKVYLLLYTKTVPILILILWIGPFSSELDESKFKIIIC